jgi:hypothetical protein
MMQQQQAMDQALLDQAALDDAAAKKKRLIIYAVLGLGAAGAAFYFIRRRKA